MSSLDASYGICGAVKETTFHAIFARGLEQSVGEVSTLDPCLPDGCDNTVEWWSDSLKKLSKEEVSLFSHAMLVHLEHTPQSNHGKRVS